MSKQTKQKVSLKKRVLPTILLSVTLPLVLCVLIPLEIYGNNLDEFMFSLSGFLPMCFLFALLLSAVIFAGLFFLPQKSYRVACTVVATLALMAFLQGTYLNAGMSSLAGDNLGDKTISVFSKVLNLVIWIVVIGGGVVFTTLFDKKNLSGIITLAVCAVVIIAQAMGPVVVIMTNNQVFTPKEDRIASEDATYVHRILTKENLTTVSTSGNVFYFCIVSFMQSRRWKNAQKFLIVLTALLLIQTTFHCMVTPSLV